MGERESKREPEHAICGLAAGPLPAHHRRTRRKYVHVGSYAASMPRKVPRRWAGKDLSRWSVCMGRAVRNARCSILDVRHTRDKRLFTRLLLVLCSKGVDDADVSAAERLICRLAVGPLPADPRRTRRKYVHVGSYAASMPRKVPRRWAGKDLSRWSVVWLQAKHGVRCSDHRVFDQLSSANRVTAAAQQSNLQNFQRPDARLAIATGSFSFDHQPTSWRGVLAGCGTLGGMDAAKEPPRTDSRRVPQAVRASRPSITELWLHRTSLRA
ncbi:Uri superfamily endonuclease [Xanthomonas arboricola]|nr:Uri superfamily endonuclease [Xanthomonas arboricola]